jgi:hypothetical protein
MNLARSREDFQRAAPLDRKGGPPPFTRDPLRSIVRAAVASGHARIDKSMKAWEHAEKQWPFDADAQLILRAATVPLDMTNTSALVQVALAVFPLLAPFSAAAQLFNHTLKLTLTREAGGYVIPNIAPVGVKFVAPGAPKPVLQGSSTAQRIDPHKVAGIAVASSELYSQASVETVIQQLLAESAGPLLDAVVFSNSAGDASHPPGLLYNVTPITPSTGGAGTSKTEAATEDLIALGAGIGPVSGAGPIALIMNVAQYISLAYRTYRQAEDVILIPSGTVPPGTAIAVACNAVVAAMGAPEFEASTSASLHMSDTPAAIGSGGSLAVPVSSMFQTASVATKMELPVSWALRSPLGVSWIQNAIW